MTNTFLHPSQMTPEQRAEANLALHERLASAYLRCETASAKDKATARRNLDRIAQIRSGK